MSSAITGTASLAHLRRNVELVAAGSLPPDLLARMDAAWQRVGRDWPGEV